MVAHTAQYVNDYLKIYLKKPAGIACEIYLKISGGPVPHQMESPSENAWSMPAAKAEKNADILAFTVCFLLVVWCGSVCLKTLFKPSENAV
ncbi:MAG: hypothetical protein IJI45_13580 [Anaerolineaceae bacterium]|nr:hypothetical protein [Anaerolineaceae bacterium]